MARPTPGNWTPRLHENSDTWTVVTDARAKPNVPPDCIAYLMRIQEGNIGPRRYEEEEMNARVLAESKNMRNLIVELMNCKDMRAVSEIQQKAREILNRLSLPLSERPKK